MRSGTVRYQKTVRILLYSVIPLFMCACAKQKDDVMSEFPVEKTDAEWKEELTPEEYRILREAGTERAFTGIYTDTEAPGVYRCTGCGAELFASESKFHSGCGWPVFDDVLSDDKVIRREDLSFGMKRVEILCASCGGHLGHVFPDGPQETTGLRYCINSAALDFDDADSGDDE